VVAAAFAAAALIVPGPFVRPGAAVAGPANIWILFDLGDGGYDWSHTFLLNPTAVNATWYATLAAATQLGLTIKWNWYACCGVAVSDVGNRNPPAGFVGLYKWDGAQNRWQFTSTGISNLVLAYGKVFVNSRNGLFALNESTGQEVWRNRVVHGVSSPAVFDSGLIVGGSDGRVHWVNATSGAERWNVSLLTNPGFSGITSSPKV